MPRDIASVVPINSKTVRLYNSKGQTCGDVHITVYGEIIGSPMISGRICKIVYREGSNRIVNTYEMPDFRLINRSYLN